ncbi:hypothetical protein [Allomesorhizobium alhagi]|jgi:hypothetical protein|nr:hypothetical protein [Mesorhizobium alhagi]
MPSIPVTWLEEFFVTASTNPQDPDIIQLANGLIRRRSSLRPSSRVIA